MSSELVNHIYGGLYIAAPEHLQPLKDWDGAIVSLDWEGWKPGRRVMVLNVTPKDRLLPTILLRATQFIDRELHQGKRVAVYSAQHVGNAAVIAMAYLVEYLKLPLPEAYALLAGRLFMFDPPREWMWHLVEAYELPFTRDTILFERSLHAYLWQQVSRNIHYIDRGIYLSGIDAMHHQQQVRDLGIEAVLRVDDGDRAVRNWSSGFEVLDLPLIDGSLLDSDSISTGTRFLNKCVSDNKKVLVHCHAGISRSATMVLAYLIEYGEMSFPDAFALIVRKRPLAYPHWALLKSLVRHYQLPFDEDSVARGDFLDTLGVITPEAEE